MLRLLAVVCGAVSAKCIYDALPPSVQVIAVWNASLCASVADGCFINRSCAELPKPQYEYQAVGDYSDCKKMPFRINGADKPVDLTMFVAPRTTNLTNLILTHFPQVEFSPTFQWPQRLANLTTVVEVWIGHDGIRGKRRMLWHLVGPDQPPQQSTARYELEIMLQCSAMG
ncbi:hypothetical protein AeNC1_017558, partial [Aphanomyces euteiches]